MREDLLFDYGIWNPQHVESCHTHTRSLFTAQTNRNNSKAFEHWAKWCEANQLSSTLREVPIHTRVQVLLACATRYRLFGRWKSLQSEPAKKPLRAATVSGALSAVAQGIAKLVGIPCSVTETSD